MDELVETLIEMPEGALLDCVVEVVSYLHPETGEEMYAWRSQGERPRSTFVGLLEMAKHDILAGTEDE